MGLFSEGIDASKEKAKKAFCRKVIMECGTNEQIKRYIKSEGISEDITRELNKPSPDIETLTALIHSRRDIDGKSVI